MRKFSVFVLTVCVVVFFLPSGGQAANPITVYSDGKMAVMEDFPHLSSDGRVMLPYGVIRDQLGGKFTWNKSTHRLAYQKDGDRRDIQIDADQYQAYREAKAKGEDGLSAGQGNYISVRFLSEASGIPIAWDENRRCVYIGDLPGKRFDPAKPMVALTFDDGPYKGRTERIVDALTEVDGRATFFVLGASVANEPDTLRYTALRGNEIGNHSYSHPKMTTLSLASLNTELEQTDQVVAAITGEAPTLIRPTYGCFNPNLQGCVSHPLVMWNIDPQDWLTKDAKATVDHVMAEVKDGDIVVMHDIHEPSVEATISLVKKLDEAGYQLVTVSEMMAAKGVEMTPGRVISHG